MKEKTMTDQPKETSAGKYLPDCMMPDGADPCQGFQQLNSEIESITWQRDEYKRLADEWCKEATDLKNKYEPLQAILSDQALSTGKGSGE